MYLNDEKITKVIDEHISKNDARALMIDGEWGIGKTFFIKKYIENKKLGVNKVDDEKVKESNKKREEKKVHYLYVSLYGIDSKKDLYDKIMMNKLKEYESKGEILSFAYRNISFFEGIIQSSVKNTGCEKILNDVDLSRVLKKISCIEGDVIFFDEFERCKVEKVELLGWIYDFLETEKCKCIIIANEKEIKESDDYFRKKEKVVELTVKYANNLKEIICTLLKKVNNIKIKEIIEGKIDLLINMMQEEKHNNIRTIKFALDSIVNIFNVIENIENIEKLKEDIVVYSFAVAISIKDKVNLNQILEKDLYRDLDRYIFKDGFKCIKNYMKNGYLDEDCLKFKIKKYQEEKVSIENEKYDYMNILIHFWEQDESDVKDALTYIYKKLNNNEYEYKKYPDLIAILIKLKNIDFEEDNVIEEIKIKMKENLNLVTNENINFNDAFMIDIADIDEQAYLENMKEFEEIYNKAIYKNVEIEINELLNFDCWGEKINSLRIKLSEKNLIKDGFLKLFDMNKLKEKISNGKIKDISDFRRGLYSYYYKLEIKVLSRDYNEIQILYEYLKSKLLKEELTSIKRFNYEKLKELLENCIKKIESVEK